MQTRIGAHTYRRADSDTGVSLSISLPLLRAFSLALPLSLPPSAFPDAMGDAAAQSRNVSSSVGPSKERTILRTDRRIRTDGIRCGWMDGHGRTDSETGGRTHTGMIQPLLQRPPLRRQLPAPYPSRAVGGPQTVSPYGWTDKRILQTDWLADRRTDGQTDGRTDGQTVEGRLTRIRTGPS